MGVKQYDNSVKGFVKTLFFPPFSFRLGGVFFGPKGGKKALLTHGQKVSIVA